MLDLPQVMTYVIALGIAAAIPGPGMTALVSRSVGSGAVAGFAMLVGLILGDLTYLSFAIFGLAVVAKSFSLLFVIIKYAACLYLSYLAWVFWTTEHKSADTAKAVTKKDLFSASASGLAISLGNPKTIAFYLALLPLVINLEAVTLQSWAMQLVPATILILLAIGSVFIFGAMSVRHFLSSDKAQKYLFRGAATAMISAAGTMALREI